MNSGGGGGTAGVEGGATGGPGGAGGDFNDAPVNGTSGQRTDDRAYTNTPGPLGPAGTDGRGCYLLLPTQFNKIVLSLAIV